MSAHKTRAIGTAQVRNAPTHTRGETRETSEKDARNLRARREEQKLKFKCQNSTTIQNTQLTRFKRGCKNAPAPHRSSENDRHRPIMPGRRAKIGSLIAGNMAKEKPVRTLQTSKAKTNSQHRIMSSKSTPRAKNAPRKARRECETTCAV